MSTAKIRHKVLKADGTYETLYAETSADVVMMEDGETNVAEAIADLQDAINNVDFDTSDLATKEELNDYVKLEGNKIPQNVLPSYVDDVEEYNNRAAFPANGETGKIYITKDTNQTYRWGGSDYVVIGSSLALGTTSATAFAGDKGDIIYNATIAGINIRNNPTLSDLGVYSKEEIDALLVDGDGRSY